MATTSSQNPRAKTLQDELLQMHTALKDLRRNFKKVQKESKELRNKAYSRADEKKVEELRKRLG